MFTYTAFDGFQLLAHGTIEEVALAVRKRQKQNSNLQILIFSDDSGRQMDWDLTGTEKQVLDRLKIFKPAQVEEPGAAGPGRPRLGVISREVSLLPQHWEWLSFQPGGASSTLRRLVDEKLKDARAPLKKLKQQQEVVYNFLSALAGNLPGFEEAIRALYRKDQKKFNDSISGWPLDIVQHTLKLTQPVFSPEGK